MVAQHAYQSMSRPLGLFFIAQDVIFALFGVLQTHYAPDATAAGASGTDWSEQAVRVRQSLVAGLHQSEEALDDEGGMLDLGRPCVIIPVCGLPSPT